MNSQPITPEQKTNKSVNTAETFVLLDVGIHHRVLAGQHFKIVQ
jgi:hypothetical protein